MKLQEKNVPKLCPFLQGRSRKTQTTEKLTLALESAITTSVALKKLSRLSNKSFASSLVTPKLTNLGVVYHNLRRLEEAIETYQEAIRIKPDYAEAHYVLGLAYVRTGDGYSALVLRSNY